MAIYALGRKFEGWALAVLATGILGILIGSTTGFVLIWFAYNWYSEPTDKSTHDKYAAAVFLVLIIASVGHLVSEVKAGYKEPIDLIETGETVNFNISVKNSDYDEENPYVYIYLPTDGTLRLEESEYEYSYHENSGYQKFSDFRLMQVVTDTETRHFFEILWADGDHFFAEVEDLRDAGHILYLYPDGRYLMIKVPFEIWDLTNHDLVDGSKEFQLTGVLYIRGTRSPYTWIAEKLMK